MYATLRRTALVLLASVSLGVTPVLVAAPATALPSYSTSPVVRWSQPDPHPTVVNLRYARHAGFDRVVVDLDGKATGYRVRYVDTLRYDGSGDRVPLPGTRFIEVLLRPAQAHDDDGRSRYRGPTLKRLWFPSLRGVALTGDFEGVVSFGLATDRRAPFRVFRLSQPNRLVIDIAH
ncbi:MAG: hypothetical protein GEU96_21750 [Propionibacteriales bacterium]|nr:hypothetical protein [Propionibacteriales bacterium]